MRTVGRRPTKCGSEQCDLSLNSTFHRPKLSSFVPDNFRLSGPLSLNSSFHRLMRKRSSFAADNTRLENLKWGKEWRMIIMKWRQANSSSEPVETGSVVELGRSHSLIVYLTFRGDISLGQMAGQKVGMQAAAGVPCFRKVWQCWWSAQAVVGQ